MLHAERRYTPVHGAGVQGHVPICACYTLSSQGATPHAVS